MKNASKRIIIVFKKPHLYEYQQPVIKDMMTFLQVIARVQVGRETYWNCITSSNYFKYYL